MLNLTKKPIVVPISNREPKRTVNQSIATPPKKIVASESTHQKPRGTLRKLYEYASKTCSWWYPKYTPSGYNWKPKSNTGNVTPNASVPLGITSRTTNILETKTLRRSNFSNIPSSSNYFVSQIILFIVDSGFSKHMTGNLKLQCNFVEKFLGTVKFGNDQIAPILGYGDLKSTCYVRDLKGNDLLTGSRGTDLYSITLQDETSSNPIGLMAKATSSQAWLWH
ncbi:hypothetical protein Tco_1224913, partial [Tanacetum coccineum]